MLFPIILLAVNLDSRSGLDLFHSRSVIRNRDGQNTAGHNCPFSSLVAWLVCFLVKRGREMGGTSSDLYLFWIDPSHRD